jgi:hypothetical protein
MLQYQISNFHPTKHGLSYNFVEYFSAKEAVALHLVQYPVCIIGPDFQYHATSTYEHGQERRGRGVADSECIFGGTSGAILFKHCTL